MIANINENYGVPNIRILVVDDELHIRHSLTRAFSLMGYDAFAASNGNEALMLLEEEPVQLVILDMKMPGLHGVEVMQQIREISTDILVIVLTGNATLDSAITAVKLSADDYLIKPTSVQDIIDSVTRALQKHDAVYRKQRLNEALQILSAQDHSVDLAKASSSGQIIVHPLRLDRSSRRVTLLNNQSEEVYLTRGETTILEVFMNNPKKVLSCTQLARLSWGYDLEEYEAQSVIRPYIFRLRQKLESNPKRPEFICTVRSCGYIFAAGAT
ncbi:MAG: response regulator transcription factor [Chloroflexi bacterium]|nr:response regulator transcription factor [Chloroflexota bacterium]